MTAGLVCPALTYGYIAACRCCIWPDGAAGYTCLERWKDWNETQQRRLKRRKRLEVLKEKKAKIS